MSCAVANPNGDKDCDGVTAPSPGHNSLNHSREPSQKDKDIEALLDFPIGSLLSGSR
jgi:hypothetical protein